MNKIYRYFWILFLPLLLTSCRATPTKTAISIPAFPAPYSTFTPTSPFTSTPDPTATLTLDAVSASQTAALVTSTPAPASTATSAPASTATSTTAATSSTKTTPTITRTFTATPTFTPTATATTKPTSARTLPRTPTRTPTKSRTRTTTYTFTPSPTTITWWQPSVGQSLQIQFSGLPVDTSIGADIFDIDLFDNAISVIDTLHDQDKKVLCYISVGSWEDWRPDAGDFPAEVIGNDYEGWEGEKWLDIRQIDILGPIMEARLELCRDIGYDGVEADNIQVYDNNTGFPITYEDQLAYALWLANEAHQRNLAIGLKNASDMVDDVLSTYDYAITESAYNDGWIDDLLPFIDADKPVFAVEYTDTSVDFAAACAWGNTNHVYFLEKDRDLTSTLVTCP